MTLLWFTSVNALGETRSKKVLKRVEDGKAGDDHLPIGEHPSAMGEI